MRKVCFILIIQFFLFMNSCRDSGTGNDIAPYAGEGFKQNLQWKTFNINDTMLVDSFYRINSSFSSLYEIAGEIYFYKSDNIDLNILNSEVLSSNKDKHNKVDFKLRYHTSVQNTFEFISDVKINNKFTANYLFGCFYSLYITIDSIYINSDTLYRTSFGDDSLNYPFLTQGKRWFVRGQKMYDSTHSRETTDLEFLSQYFSNQILSEIYFYPENLYDGTTYIKRRQ